MKRLVISVSSIEFNKFVEGMNLKEVTKDKAVFLTLHYYNKFTYNSDYSKIEELPLTEEADITSTLKFAYTEDGYLRLTDDSILKMLLLK